MMSRSRDFESYRAPVNLVHVWKYLSYSWSILGWRRRSI